MTQEQWGVLVVAGALGSGPLAGGNVDCPDCLALGEPCLACRQGQNILRQLLSDYLAAPAREEQ